MTETVSIEFPMWAGRLLRGRVCRGLARWSSETGYPVDLEEARTWHGSRFWVTVTAPAAAEAAVRTALPPLDGPRHRQAWWAVRATTRQASHTERAARRPAQDPEPAPGTPDYQHIVGWWNWLLGTVLFRRWLIPETLCGISMERDPARPDITPDAPYCPECLARNGGTAEGVKWVQGYWP